MVTPATSNPEAVQLADAASIRGNKSFVLVWTHLFFNKAEGRLKSYLLQYEIDCINRSVAERRFIDFDASYAKLESGDNSKEESGRFRSVAPETIGDLTVSFACGTDQYRKDNFLKVDPSLDYRKVAEFYLERGELVESK